MSDKKIQKEGILDATDKFITAFFDGLKKGAADSIIKQAEKAKLPKEHIKSMEALKKMSDKFKNDLKKL